MFSTSLLETSHPFSSTSHLRAGASHTRQVFGRRALSRAASNHSRSPRCGNSEENKRSRWTHIRGLHPLSTDLHAFARVAGKICGFAEGGLHDSERLSPRHPTPSPSPGTARLGMTLGGFEMLRSLFLNQLLKQWNPTQAAVVPTKVRAVRYQGICVSVYLCALIRGLMWEGLDWKEILSAPSEFLSVFPSVNQIWLTKNLKCEHWNCTFYLFI